MAKSEKTGVPANFWRRLVQAALLLLFLVLFRMTDFQEDNQIPHVVNIFFRLDPLVAASAMLAGKVFIEILLPASIVIVLTAVLGRFFCGWVCPMGTCLDAAYRVVKPKEIGTGGRFRRYKYYLLAAVLASAVFGFQLAGYFDPLAILTRALAVAVDPAFNLIVTEPFTILYQRDPVGISAVSEPVYEFLKDTAKVLPYQQAAFVHAWPSLIVLLLIFLAEKIERRFWCKNLCPLGGMLALMSRWSLLKLAPGKACKADGCSTCIDICRMGAIDDEGLVSPEACNLCLDCMVDCDKGIVSFKFKRPKHQPAPIGATRRGVLGALLTGAALPAFGRAGEPDKAARPFLIRPPGAREEGEFLSRCVRCGECMKVCIKNALHPAAFEAGVEGVFSPILIPRLGYCEYNCTLCGQVCPTGAIERLAKDDKQKVVIGGAYFVRDRCMPWARGVPCAVCEEMCPLPDKAIELVEGVSKNEDGEDIKVQLPYVSSKLCIGCGTCEHVCPLDGEAGIRVSREGESRDMGS